MTDQEINITIAELMGIPMEGSWCEHCQKFETNPRNCMHPVGQRIPQNNYCDDLNSMHEIIDALSLIELTDFGCELVSILKCEHWGKIASCSAKQQAIAFLRVKGIKI